jgi:chromosome segregation protein
MYLKKIEMVGFKSFADRTKIEFDTGITAIVGPNGSGKSNVTESLRWALGEQSAKSLRGGKMPDIIFAGTQTRKPLNFAEVTVTFDNNDNFLAGGREVTVTRKLYRNGDSEFLIDGKKTRLRDIQELFMDTGLGRDSFSIISQGKIESIFNSKPEERRAIIEEAAGVLKYKTRKKETASKLASTQENIDRLEDIIYELNGQLEPLKAQKEKAEAYLQLEAQRVTLELSVLVAQLQEGKSRLDDLNVQLDEMAADLKTMEASQEASTTELNELKDSRRALEAQQEGLQGQVVRLTQLEGELKSRLAIIAEQAKAQAQTQADREQREASLQGDLETSRHQLQGQEQELASTVAAIQQLESQLEGIDQQLARFGQSPEETIEQMREDFLALINEEVALSNKSVQFESQLNHLKEQAVSQASDRTENQARYANLTAELDQATVELKTKSATIQDLLAEYQETVQGLNDAKTNLENARNLLFTAMSQQSNLKNKLQNLKDIQASHANYFQSVKVVLNNADQIGGLIGTVADQLTFEPKYMTAIDLALGGAAQNIITEDDGAAKRAIAFLKQKGAGRATFLPLTTVKPRDFRDYDRVSGMTGFIDLAINLVNYDPRLENVMSNLLGTTLVVDTLDHASDIARQMRHTVRIVTLDGSQINPGGSYTGGSNKKNATSFTQVELDKLARDLKEQDESVRLFEADLKEAQDQTEDLTARLDQLKSDGESARIAEQGLKVQVENLRSQVKDLGDVLAVDLDQAESAQVASLTQQLTDNQAELARISKKKADLEAEIDQLKASGNELSEMRGQAESRQSELSVQLAEQQVTRKHLESEIDRLKGTIKTLEAELAGLHAAMREMAATDDDPESLQDQLAQVSQRVMDMQQQLEDHKVTRQDLSDQIAKVEADLTTLQTAYQARLREQSKAEVLADQVKENLLARQSHLSESHNLSFEAAKSQAEPIEDLVQAERQLRGFERDIKRLGPVNTDAIAQFEEVNERHSFLSKQSDDLTKAKEMLQGTIDEMDAEVKHRFETTFQAIRTSFQSTFVQMFGGGSADLELTTDDLLDAGIEIAVQPPGKKLASLNLMSGGEKALTALALLFAILKVRTVPFVVLDEVEAALDEANVKRFGDFMTKFDNASQFIVVTHRKGTMAAANVMYGVTMQESGVSKLVSVKLKEALALTNAKEA